MRFFYSQRCPRSNFKSAASYATGFMAGLCDSLISAFTLAWARLAGVESGNSMPSTRRHLISGNNICCRSDPANAQWAATLWFLVYSSRVGFATIPSGKLRVSTLAYASVVSARIPTPKSPSKSTERKELRQQKHRTDPRRDCGIILGALFENQNIAFGVAGVATALFRKLPLIILLSCTGRQNHHVAR